MEKNFNYVGNQEIFIKKTNASLPEIADIFDIRKIDDILLKTNTL